MLPITMNQKGFTYITTTLIIFGVLLWIFILPKTYPKPSSRGLDCVSGEEPSGLVERTLPAVMNRDGGRSDPGGFDTTKQTTFRLIRKRVPIEIEEFFVVKASEHYH